MRPWTILIFLATSCSIGKKEVTYDEMSLKPKVNWESQKLIVKTDNSIENSASLIYEIKPTIDKENNLILLRGLQAVGKKYKTEFKLKIEGVPIDKHDDYKIFWVDPDGRRTELKIE